MPHILFIDRSQDSQLDAIVAGLKSRSILTVGNKIRLRVNLTAAQEAKLTISSKLLRPAQIVESGHD
jgi:hypothetical protein